MEHKRVKLKGRRRRKRFIKLKILFYFLCIYLGFAYTFYYSLNSKRLISNEEFINLLVSTGNVNILHEYKVSNVINKTMSLEHNDLIKIIEYTEHKYIIY